MLFLDGCCVLQRHTNNICVIARLGRMQFSAVRCPRNHNHWM
jgi:hypothetical protein